MALPPDEVRRILMEGLEEAPSALPPPLPVARAGKRVTDEQMAEAEAAMLARVDQGVALNAPILAGDQELPAYIREAEDRARARAKQQVQTFVEAGRRPQESRSTQLRSRFIKGTNLVFDEDTGEPRPATALELVIEPLKRQRLASGSEAEERARFLREGLVTAESPGAGLAWGVVSALEKPEDVSEIAAPTSGVAIEETGVGMGLRFLGALEPYISETIFGGDLLFYEVDEQGNARNPDSIAYRGEKVLEWLAPEYAAQGRFDPYSKAGSAFKYVPRLFQATTRQRGERAVPGSKASFMVNAANAVAQGRSLGDEFVSVPGYDTGDELFLGLKEGHLAGMGIGFVIPTPMALLRLPGMIGKGAGTAGRAAAAATDTAKVAAAANVVEDVLNPVTALRRKGVQAAAQDLLGVRVEGRSRETLRALAADEVASQAGGSAVALAAAANDALAAGSRWIDPAELAARFGGDTAAARIIAAAGQGADGVDAYRLIDAAKDSVNAPLYGEALRLLAEGGDDAADKVRRMLASRLTPAARQSMEQATDVGQWIRSRLGQVGGLPNMNKPALRRLYAIADEAMRVLESGESAADLFRAGAKFDRATFQRHLAEALIEEGIRSGRTSAQKLASTLRQGVNPSNLAAALDANEGAVRHAVGEAVRRSMRETAMDTLLQALPDDYVMLTPRTLIKASSAEETRKAVMKEARKLFRATGTMGNTVLVGPDGSVDDIVRALVAEVGPEGVRSSQRVKRILRKILNEQPLDEVETKWATDTLLDRVASRMGTGERVVTSGAQTAVSRSGEMAVRNLLFKDAVTGKAVGGLNRAAKAGWAGASLLADDLSQAAWVGPVFKQFSKWNDRLGGRAYFKPGSAPEAFDAALRETVELLATSKDRVQDALSAAKNEVGGGPRASDKVAVDMLLERREIYSEEYLRALIATRESGRFSGKMVEAAIEEARIALSGTLNVTDERTFQAGMGAVKEGLKRLGVTLDDVRQMPARDAAEILAEVVADRKMLDDGRRIWMSLLQSMVPGSKVSGVLEKQDVVAAIERLTGLGSAKTADDILQPTASNLQKVMEELVELSPDVLEQSLRYPLDVFGKAEGQAWQQGYLAWLVQQRAGMDASQAINRAIDLNPDQVLALAPRTAGEAARVQEAAVDVFMDRLTSILGKMDRPGAVPVPGRDDLVRALDRARMAAATGQPIARSDKLAQAMGRAWSFIQKLDTSLSDQGRLEVAKVFHRQMIEQGTVHPDMGFLSERVLEAMATGAKESGGLRALGGGMPRLKGEVGQMMARHEVGAPLRELLGTADSPQLQEALVDAMYGALLQSTSNSMLRPVYDSYRGAVMRWGFQLGDSYAPPSGMRVFDADILDDDLGRRVGTAFGMDAAESFQRLQVAVASGRLQATLDDLAAAGSAAGKGRDPVWAGIARGVMSSLQAVMRGMRSSLLAGGGPLLAFIPHTRYLGVNQLTAPAIMVATIGAANTRAALAALPEAARSIGRQLAKTSSVAAIRRGLAPGPPDRVVLRGTMYGDITAQQLDELMGRYNIRFSRANIESYDSAAQELMRAAGVGGPWAPGREPGWVTKLWRQLAPWNKNVWMQVAEYQDNLYRQAVFIGALDQGKTIEDAAALARESLLDYGKVATGADWEKGLQRWLMYWSFRRQSFITTINALASGSLDRGELLGRWLRVSTRQKQAASPEEYAFGPDYLKLRGLLFPGTEDGFTVGPSSVYGENLADLLGAGMMAGELLAVPFSEDVGGAAANASARLGEAILEENIQPVAGLLIELMLAQGRGEDRGPVVPDTTMAQMQYLDQVYPGLFAGMYEAFNMEPEVDPETGEFTTTPGRGTLTRGYGRPYQLRFKTNADYLYFQSAMLALSMVGMGRTPDDVTKMLLTVGAAAPKDYQPRYRALAGTIGFMTGMSTPMRTRGRVEQIDEARAEKLRQMERRTR